MQPKSARDIDDALGDLPLDDRVCALVCSIITRRPEAVDAVVAMLAVTAAMTRELSIEQRVAVAELTRDTADTIEKRREIVAA